MKRSLLSEPRYKKFTDERDKALEKIHIGMDSDLTDIMDGAFKAIEGATALVTLKAPAGVYVMHALSSRLQSSVDQIFTHTFPVIVERIKRMRKSVFILTYASECEAIGRASQRVLEVTPQEFKKKMTDAINAKTSLGHDLDKRVWLNLMKVRGKIIEAFNLAVVQELKPDEIVAKVVASFPPKNKFKRPRRLLRNMKEAKKLPGKDDEGGDIYDYDFIDQADWDGMVEDYKDTAINPERFDNETVYVGDDGVEKYAWQLEQEATDDFVSQVRDGQIQAANDLGVKDFVWVAIVDDKTDKCCLSRMGKTSEEIQDALDSGKLDADLCDAIVPPGHFNCRCKPGPVTDVDPVEGPDWNDFGDWLGAA